MGGREPGFGEYAGKKDKNTVKQDSPEIALKAAMRKDVPVFLAATAVTLISVAEMARGGGEGWAYSAIGGAVGMLGSFGHMLVARVRFALDTLFDNSFEGR
ncbi:MAG: hypothetical protein KGH54_01900 [Candidatus Micrarchaeota archaeon]|nr:hypothetical protein [Candidatus Micrarchaeota archaeon]